jgi:hypothetical protein
MTVEDCRGAGEPHESGECRQRTKAVASGSETGAVVSCHDPDSRDPADTPEIGRSKSSGSGGSSVSRSGSLQSGRERAVVLRDGLEARPASRKWFTVFYRVWSGRGPSVDCSRRWCRTHDVREIFSFFCTTPPTVHPPTRLGTLVCFIPTCRATGAPAKRSCWVFDASATPPLPAGFRLELRHDMLEPVRQSCTFWYRLGSRSGPDMLAAPVPGLDEQSVIVQSSRRTDWTA